MVLMALALGMRIGCYVGYFFAGRDASWYSRRHPGGGIRCCPSARCAVAGSVELDANVRGSVESCAIVGNCTWEGAGDFELKRLNAQVGDQERDSW